MCHFLLSLFSFLELISSFFVFQPVIYFPAFASNNIALTTARAVRSVR